MAISDNLKRGTIYDTGDIENNIDRPLQVWALPY